MIGKTILLLPAFACTLLFGRGESKPWKMDAGANDPAFKVTSLNQVIAEKDPERRAMAGVDFAAVAERNAEAAFSRGDTKAVAVELNTMRESVELARDALIAGQKTPGRNPELYKYAELHSRELLIRLGDFEQNMFAEDRDVVAIPKAKVGEIHDYWLDAIMRRKD